MNQTIEEVTKKLSGEIQSIVIDKSLGECERLDKYRSFISFALTESNAKLLEEVEAYRKEMVEYNQGQMKLVKWLCANGFEESCENSYDLIISQLSAQSAEIAELKSDKERLDWLEKNNQIDPCMFGRYTKEKPSARQAIDQARKV